MKFLIIGLLAIFSSISFADNTVLDFNSLVHNDDEYTYHDELYIEDNFILDANNKLGFASWGTLSEHYAGSPSLINDAGPGFTSLRKQDNGLFNLVSIDLAGLLISTPAVGVTGVYVVFTGTKADNSLINQTFTGPLTSSTYTFNNFTNLKKVEWLQDNETLGLHQFDNVVLTAVPEPNIAWLLAAGLISVTLLRRQN